MDKEAISTIKVSINFSFNLINYFFSFDQIIHLNPREDLPRLAQNHFYCSRDIYQMPQKLELVADLNQLKDPKLFQKLFKSRIERFPSSTKETWKTRLGASEAKQAASHGSRERGCCQTIKIVPTHRQHKLVARGVKSSAKCPREIIQPICCESKEQLAQPATAR